MVTMKTASFLFALEHMGGFGGVADRLNAYNVFRGDPSLITTDLERFQRVTPEAIQAAARSYLDGKSRVALSVIGPQVHDTVARPWTARSLRPPRRRPSTALPLPRS